MRTFVKLSACLAMIFVIGMPVQADDDLTIGPRFQKETSFGHEGLKAAKIGWGEEVPLYKSYSDVERFALSPLQTKDTTILAVLKERRSARSFADSALSPPDLSSILLAAYGLTAGGEEWSRRSVASAGALYPLELYIVVTNVESLPAGLYHFQESDSSLALIREGNFHSEIREAANDQESVGSSPATIVITARFDRTTRKYADRGYRYVYMEAGAVMQNVYLQCATIGAGTVAVGAFNDDLLNDFLKIDGLHEGALLVMPVGYPR